ncbi:MAG TPA: hypothetical protein VFH24_06400 [Gemmatimonadales bacterium]|nr:hypothetical protein [Gemmatimonadales bacterium]
MARWARILAAAALLTPPPSLSAQGEPVLLRYSSAQLNCARFLEDSESKILTEAGRREQHQSTGRRGVWRFTATPDSAGVALEGWLDSLAIWRRLRTSVVRPDTDGLLGGRYRGLLTPDGIYQSRKVPFVPAEVAELADMATALDDLLPPLPDQPLRPGQAWTDSAGVTVRRLADSGMSGVPLYRFQLEERRTTNAAGVPGDTTMIRLRQSSEEQGTFVWHPSVGLIRRERHITLKTTVPARGVVQQTVRSRIEQKITLSRDLHVPPEIAGRCGEKPV